MPRGTGASAARLRPWERPEDWIWAFFPGLVWRRAPALGLVLSDGGWLRGVPGLGLAAPAVAFLLGLWRGGFRPADQVTYSYSLTWLCLFLVLALAGCGIGVSLWLGFVVGDLMFFGHPPLAPFGQPVSVWDQVSQFVVPHLISYLLLAVLLVGAPLAALLARGSVAGLLAGAAPGVRAGFGAAAAAVAAGLHAGLWTQAFPLLVRPLWTWRERLSNPDADAIVPVQEHLWLVGLVAGAAAAGWAVLAFRGLARIVGRRYQPIAAVPSAAPPNPVRLGVGAVLRAGLTTLLLAGLIPDYWRGVAAFAVLTAVFLAQVATVPWAIRLVLAAAVAWAVAYLIGRTTYQTLFGQVTVVTADDFAPLLYAAVAATACIALLLPATRPDRESAGPVPGAGAPEGHAGSERP
jgi:hypothetical protein